MAEGDRADQLLALVVDRLAEAGLVKQWRRVRTDSTHVLAAVRRLNRGEVVPETLRCALEELALQGETWLAALPTLGDGHPRLSVLFPRKACRECEDRLKCTGNVDGKGRHILVLPGPQQKIQSLVRKEQKTSNWQWRYAIRAGCEATASETVHAHGLRHFRYRGLAKTHVQHVRTAAGTNIVRLREYFPPGTTPASPRRPPGHFQRLCQRLTTKRSPTASGN
jgi:hypothetical protein